MSSYQVKVDSKANSIQGGQPSILTFSDGALNYGDVLSITTSTSTVWNSGGNVNGTNADGAQVTVSPGGVVNIDWNSVVPCNPSISTVLPLYSPAAANYTFGVGCLVGTIDSGATYFPIGTNFSLVYLGPGMSSSAPTNICLFFWDLNQGDNQGSITFDITLDRASSNS
jgi:hypothetical protein